MAMRLIFAEQFSSESDSPDDSLASRYVRGFAEGMTVGNVSTRMALLDTGTRHWVVTINDGDEPADNCYVVSARTTYSGYAREELARLRRPLLTAPLRWLTRGVDGLLERARVDRMVWLNNWLLSTNLYRPDLSAAELSTVTDFMRATFTDRAFGWRSVNDFCNPGLCAKLRALGYISVPSRQVYLFDGRDGARSGFLRRHNTRIDETLLRRSRYTVVPGEQLEWADLQRIEHLYNLLYLEKYCSLNPHYSARWIQRGQREGWLQLRVLRNPEGRIDGALGWFTDGNVLSAPIVGYDTGLEQREGLYRQLTRLCLREAADRGQLLNFSSGAAAFKRLRGGQPCIEYSLLYVAHLPWSRRVVWRVLACLLHGIAVPLIKRLKL